MTDNKEKEGLAERNRKFEMVKRYERRLSKLGLPAKVIKKRISQLEGTCVHNK